MKVFIAMKVPRGDESLCRAATLLSATVKSAGHQPFVATEEITGRGLQDPHDFMPFVRTHLCDAELVLLLYHPELRGGLIEAGMAYAWNIPVWLCHQTGERVSSSMRGCAAMALEYTDLDDLHDKLLRCLTEGSIPDHRVQAGNPAKGF